MKKTIIKKMLLSLVIFLALYLVVGNLMHRVIFPEKRPDVASYFKPGHEFYSKAEGFRQKVSRQEKGFVHGHLEVEPFAPGPPKHIHDDFDETFQIENGELTVWVAGEIRKLRPGQVLLIPKGTPHKPFNETADTIRVKGSFAFREDFAFQLQQVYGFMDENPNFAKSPKTIFQMALFQQAGFDSYVADGPPVPVQKAMGFMVGPLARLLGFKSYYEKYDVHKGYEAKVSN